MLNVQRLRVLQAVAESGSFSRAAEALSYTQSAVSQAVATLEHETGATLLDRDRRGVRPTAVGAALVAHADAILARIGDAESDLEAIVTGRGGRLRMASFPTAGATLMPLAIAAFRERRPRVELSLAEAEPDEIVPRLRAGELDLALLFEFPDAGPLVGGHGLRRADLLEDLMYLALPEHHPLAERAELRLEDLAGEAWVQTSASSPCARHVVHACRSAGFDPTVSFESDDYATVQGLVAAGVGVALIPQLALTGVRHDVRVRALHPQGPVRRIVAATPAADRALPAATLMLEVLDEVARAYRTRDLASVAWPYPGDWAGAPLGAQPATPPGKPSDGTSEG